MREFRTSGSVEGPGRATSPVYSTKLGAGTGPAAEGSWALDTRPTPGLVGSAEATSPGQSGPSLPQIRKPEWRSAWRLRFTLASILMPSASSDAARELPAASRARTASAADGSPLPGG